MNEINATDIFSAAFKRDPYAFYARLREAQPATRVRLQDGQGAWLLVRYDDVASMLRDPASQKTT